MTEPLIPSLSASQLQALLVQGEPLTLVDVRTPEEYLYLGHLSGTCLIPLHELPARLQELNPQAKTVLICQHGVRSMDAAHFLKAKGFVDVYNLEEGMSAWDGPVER